MQIAHLNGIRTDNRLGNLKEVSPKENQAHRVKHGTDNRGSKNGVSKLTEKQVFEIVKLLPYKSSKETSKDFDVNFATIDDIRRGRSWKHLTGIIKSIRILKEYKYGKRI